MLRRLLRLLLVMLLAYALGASIRGLWLAVSVPPANPTPAGYILQGMSR